MGTELASGKLYGNPSYALGCETVCGSRMYWKIYVDTELLGPEYEEVPFRRISSTKLTEITVPKHFATLRIEMIPKDTAGGVCVGDWENPDKPVSYIMAVDMKHMYGGRRLIKDSTFKVTGGQSITIPITEYGSYSFEFSPHEWGEDCNKPNKGNKKWIIKVIDPSGQDTNGGSNDFDDEPIEPNQDDERETLFEAYYYPVAMIAGLGVFIAVSALFKE